MGSGELAVMNCYSQSSTLCLVAMYIQVNTLQCHLFCGQAVAFLCQPDCHGTLPRYGRILGVGRDLVAVLRRMKETGKLPTPWRSVVYTDAFFELPMPYPKWSRGKNILNIWSVLSRNADFTAPGAYGSFRAALLHCTSQLTLVLAKVHVRANSVPLGNSFVEGGLWGATERNGPGFLAQRAEAKPMESMGEPKEEANTVVWPASEEASFING